MNASDNPRPARGIASVGVGLWALTLASLLGLIVSVFNYTWTGNGIHGTEGALLVLVSTALILIAAMGFAFRVWRPRWLRVVFDVLLFLGILGTAVAAYFLEAFVLLALMAIAGIGWLLHLFEGRPRVRPVAEGATP